jgi:integrase
MTKLTNKKIEAFLRAGHQGRLLDGDGLLLQCQGKGHDGAGRASWVLRYTVKGQVRELGLGSWKNVKLAEARAAAAQARAAVFKGDDPIAAKHPAKAKQLASPTFGAAAASYWEANRPRWKNNKVRTQWIPFLARHCKAIWDQPINEIDKHAVLAVISPIWTSKHCFAKRCLHRIGQVIKYAKFMGWRSGDNPAEYRDNLSHGCPRPANLNTRHHPALPLAQLPEFMAQLMALPGTAALAARFAILTCSRVSEAFLATWDEIDLEAQVFKIPAPRYKTGKEHVVPLSTQAMQVLSRCPRFDGNPYVFPSPSKPGAPLSNMAGIVLLKRMGVQTTLHGTARSTFADWAADCTNFDFEVREGCLGHVVGTAVTRAYRRGDALMKRRALLTLWGQTIAPQEVVVPFKAAAE